jgi:CRP-like cAMP-binding protein
MANLGKQYRDGEVIFRQGDTGECMFVIQKGEVEVFVDSDGKELTLRTMGANEFFGEMALFEKETRSATARAVGPAHVLTIDKKNFLAGIHEDPSLAFRIVKTMSNRIRNLTDRLAAYEETH